MKRSIIFFVSVCIFITLLFSGITMADTPIIIKKIDPPKVPFKKLVADLYVQHIEVTPPCPRKGKDMVTIKVTIKNIGTATPSKTCSWSMAIININTHPDYMHQIIPGYTNNIPRLAPNATVVISSTITIPYTGMYHLSGIINTEGLQVGEENSQNNHYTLPIQVVDPPLPSDLVLDSLMPSNDGRIRIKMHNQGSPIPDIDFNKSLVRVVVKDTNNTIEKSMPLKDMDPTGLLKLGETPVGSGINRIYLEYIWPDTGAKGIKLLPGNTYEVRVVLDYNCFISETNRANNGMTVVWHMTP